MTLYGDYLYRDHRRIHKWYHYFPAYEAHFERFRNRHVTLFEIGVGEGGSLEQWRGYFGPFATIVGIDIYPRCRQLEQDQIHIRIGSQTDRAFLSGLVEEFGRPDIVIDDGSHIQSHINTTFDVLYPQVTKNGVYLVEDLHAAYWPNHGGGLRRPGSFIETAKDMVDRMHADYMGETAERTTAADRTKSIHFYDSVVVFEVGEHQAKGNATTGDPSRFDGRWAPPGIARDTFAQYVDETLKDIETPGSAHETESASPGARDGSTAVLQAGHRQHVERLEQDLRILRASTSWRVTSPLRAIKRTLSRLRRAVLG